MAQLPETNGLTLEVIRIVLPSLLVIAGWYVVYQIQRGVAARTETRKDLRNRIDLLNEDLRDLRDCCIKYYTDIEAGSDLSTQIKVLIEDIRGQAFIISDHFLEAPDQEKVIQLLTKIANSATGGRFESKNRIALDSNSIQLLTLFSQSEQLRKSFELGFIQKYPPTKN